MTKKDSPYFKVAKQSCKRYFIQILEIENKTLTREELLKCVQSKTSNLNYIIIGITKTVNELLEYNILIEFYNSINPLIVKSLIKNCFKYFEILIEPVIMSCNNKFTAIRKISSFDFDCIFSGSVSTELFSESYRLEHWARTNILKGVCEKDDPFVKNGNFGWKKCNQYLQEKIISSQRAAFSFYNQQDSSLLFFDEAFLNNELIELEQFDISMETLEINNLENNTFNELDNIDTFFFNFE